MAIGSTHFLIYSANLRVNLRGTFRFGIDFLTKTLRILLQNWYSRLPRINHSLITVVAEQQMLQCAVIIKQIKIRRDGRVVEGARLERVYT